MSESEGPGEPEALADQLDAIFEEELDRIDTIELTPECADGVERHVDTVERAQRDDGVSGRCVQAKPGGGDDRERSLATAQQPGEIEARVVLLEPVEATDHTAVGEHGLDADELAPGRAVAQHVHTARVGRDHAPDRRDVARPRSTPYCQPASLAAARNRDRVTPACALSWPVRASTGPTASKRRRSSTTSPWRGTEPPTRPVLPP